MSFLAYLLPLAVYCFPVAVYCLILAFLNRSRHPVVVRGTWDMVGVLFAASGFLLFGGPDILSTVYEQQRSAWVLKKPHLVSGYGEAQWLFWVGLWFLYFALVGGGAAYLLRRRRSVTTVYNVDPAVFEEVLDQVLDSHHGAWSRQANAIALDRRAGWAKAPPEREPSASRPFLVDPFPTGPEIVLELDPFPAMRHVTLYWREGTETLRKEIEVALTAALTQVRSGYNPAGGWFLSLAACLFCGTFFSLLVLVAAVIWRVAR